MRIAVKHARVRAQVWRVERREAQRPPSLGARASQAVTPGNREWP